MRGQVAPSAERSALGTFFEESHRGALVFRALPVSTRNMKNELLTARELAERFGIDVSGMRKWLRSHNAEVVPYRDPSRGNHKQIAVTKAEARRLIALRREEGFQVQE